MRKQTEASPIVTSSLDEFAGAKLDSLKKSKRLRKLREVDRAGQSIVHLNGGTLVSFACNDYLGLSHHPEVIAASIEATREHGVGAGASRLISGNHSLYAALESTLARVKGTEDAVVFGSGYLANLGVISALAGASDLICLDALSHSCLLAGSELARSHILRFEHNDMQDLARILDENRKLHRHCLILTEGVFSMDGDLAPLPALAQLAARHDAWLMTDDAHGLGVVGGGRGSGFAHAIETGIPLQMGTLSKAVGGYGGYVCASRIVCDFLRNRARTLIYSTGLPPGTVAAATRALEIIESRGIDVERPLSNARRFTGLFGLEPAESPIVPIVVGSSQRALDISAALEKRGFLVPAIRPPTVPATTARLRIAFTAMHDETDVARLAEEIQRLGLGE